MPAPIDTRAGHDCHLYYNTTIAATITPGSFSEIKEVIDLNVPFSIGKIDAPSRLSKFKPKIPGLTELSLTFGYNYQGDPNDTVLTALRTAFLNRTPWHWAVLDNLISSPGTAGAQGIVFPGIIYDFPLDQPLEGACKIDIGVELCRFKVSGTLVDPSWLVVAPT